jgi:outer membrane protein OmpA-like peptidoglycan-associated protein
MSTRRDSLPGGHALKHNFFLRGFFKDRGYESAADLKKNEISQLPDEPAENKVDYEAKKIFDKPDTAKLKDEKHLNDAGDYLQSNQFGLAVIAAYTDMKGDSGKDQLLTEARAIVIRDYFVRRHFKLQDTRIKTIGLGKIRQGTRWRECRNPDLPKRHIRSRGVPIAIT